MWAVMVKIGAASCLRKADLVRLRFADLILAGPLFQKKLRRNPYTYHDHKPHCRSVEGVAQVRYHLRMNGNLNCIACVLSMLIPIHGQAQSLPNYGPDDCAAEASKAGPNAWVDGLQKCPTKIVNDCSASGSEQNVLACTRVQSLRWNRLQKFWMPAPPTAARAKLDSAKSQYQEETRRICHTSHFASDEDVSVKLCVLQRLGEQTVAIILQEFELLE